MLFLSCSLFVCNHGAPGGIRTLDLPVRSRALYPLSYRRIFCVLQYFITTGKGCQHFLTRNFQIFFLRNFIFYYCKDLSSLV